MEAARSYYKLSLAYHYSGQLVPAQFAVFAGLNLAESAGAASQLTEELARGYATAGSTVGGGFRLHAAADNSELAVLSLRRDSDIHYFSITSELLGATANKEGTR